MMFRQEKTQQEWNHDKNSNWNHGAGDPSEHLYTDLVRNTHRFSESKDVHAASCSICTSLVTGVCPALIIPHIPLGYHSERS